MLNVTGEDHGMVRKAEVDEALRRNRPENQEVGPTIRESTMFSKAKKLANLRNEGATAPSAMMTIQVDSLRKELRSLAQDTFLRDFSEIASGIREDMLQLGENIQSDIKREISVAMSRQELHHFQDRKPRMGVQLPGGSRSTTTEDWARRTASSSRGLRMNLRQAALGADDDSPTGADGAFRKQLSGSNSSSPRQYCAEPTLPTQVPEEPPVPNAEEAAPLFNRKGSASSISLTNPDAVNKLGMQDREVEEITTKPSEDAVRRSANSKYSRLSAISRGIRAINEDEDSPRWSPTIKSATSATRNDGTNSWGGLAPIRKPTVVKKSSDAVKKNASATSSNIRLVGQELSAESCETKQTEPGRPVNSSRESSLKKRNKLSLHMQLARKRSSAGSIKKIQSLSSINNLSAAEILQSTRFDNVIGALILLNAVTIGLQTDIMAQEMRESVPFYIRVMDLVFLVCFSVELLLRLYVHRLRFFWMENKLWNWFDFTVVVLQCAEELLLLVADLVGYDTGDGSGGAKNLKLLRVMRILRLMRILRVMRVLRLISELRTIVSSIVGSMKSLAWTIVLLSIFIYVVSVYFTQSVNDLMVEHDGDLSGRRKELRDYFGSLSLTILSLYQAMSGGLDWGDLTGPLIDESGFLMGAALVSYVAFATLALLNVVTGVFVQTALQSAKVEEDKFLTDQICSLFRIGENEGVSDKIDIDLVDAILKDPKAQREWKSIDVQAEEARYLFFLLDTESTGQVHFEEFLSGCLRLHGPAKAIDLLTIMQELRTFYHRSQKFQNEVLDTIDFMAQDMVESRVDETDLLQTMNNGIQQLARMFKDERRARNEQRRQLEDLNLAHVTRSPSSDLI